jgi:hypothetical protein
MRYTEYSLFSRVGRSKELVDNRAFTFSSSVPNDGIFTITIAAFPLSSPKSFSSDALLESVRSKVNPFSKLGENLLGSSARVAIATVHRVTVEANRICAQLKK